MSTSNVIISPVVDNTSTLTDISDTEVLSIDDTVKSVSSLDVCQVLSFTSVKSFKGINSTHNFVDCNTILVTNFSVNLFGFMNYIYV